MEFLLTGLGITILVLGANWLIEGASSLALRLGISKLVVGLSVVAFGTSLPELVSSIVSASKGYTSIAISNVVGSNIANVGLCLGLAALFRAIPVKKSTIRSEIPFMILSTLSFISLFLKTTTSHGTMEWFSSLSWRSSCTIWSPLQGMWWKRKWKR